jgi:hydrogenase expression/formation protein HypC
MCLGIPAQIKEIIDIDNQIAMVDLSGVSRAVNIACVLNDTHQAQDLINQWVLVHVGFALSIVDEFVLQFSHITCPLASFQCLHCFVINSDNVFIKQ